MQTPKDIRRARGLPLIQVAARASVSEHTARVYEAAPGAVSDQKREALDRVYRALAAENERAA